MAALPGLIDMLAEMGQEYLSMNMGDPHRWSGGVCQTSANEQIGEIVLGLKARANERGLRFVWYPRCPIAY